MPQAARTMECVTAGILTAGIAQKFVAVQVAATVGAAEQETVHDIDQPRPMSSQNSKRCGYGSARRRCPPKRPRRGE